MQLSDFLRWRERLVPGEITQIGMGLAFALTKYHCHGIPYGEFGIENVYVLSDGRATLSPQSDGSRETGLKSEASAWTMHDDVIQLARVLHHIAQRSGLAENRNYQPIRLVLGAATESPGLVGSFALALARACSPVTLSLNPPSPISRLLLSRSLTDRIAQRRRGPRVSPSGTREPLISNWLVFGLLGGAALTSWGLVIGLLLLTQLG